MTKKSASDEAVAYVAGAIISGELPGGSRIRDDEVAKELGVSRVPVREALQRLERIGLVSMMPSRGTVVTEVTEESARRTLRMAGYQGGAMFHASVPRFTEAQRCQTLALIDELLRVVGDIDAEATARSKLFMFVATSSTNSLHSTIFPTLELAIMRDLASPVARNVNSVRDVAVIRELREAVVTGDGNEAERAIRRMSGIDIARPE